MIISFEGINFSGKTTQVSMLDGALQSRGIATSQFGFPSDDTPIGTLLRSSLRGECDIPVEAMFALFSANRLERRADIMRSVERHQVVLCDRYSESEYAYGAARGLEANWLAALESQMPRADCVVLLDIEYETAVQRCPLNYPLDIFERDRDYIYAARREYLRLAGSGRGDARRWIKIDASQSADDVHKCILSTITPLLQMFL